MHHSCFMASLPDVHCAHRSRLTSTEIRPTFQGRLPTSFLAVSLALGSLLAQHPAAAQDTPSGAASSAPAPSLTPGSSRVLEPGRGEKQLGLDYAFRASSQAFGTDGLADPTDPPAIWSVHEMRLSGAFGLTRKASVGFFVPVVYPRLENGLLDTPLVNPLPYPGDTSFWYHQRLKEDLRAGSSLTLEVRGQAPTGLESPGDQGTTLLTGTGIPELEAGLRWRKRLSGVGLELAGSYQTYISQVVAYTEAVYSAELRGEGRFDPGDRVGGSVVVQLAPASWLFLELENRVGHQAAARVGTTSSRFLPGRDLDPIAGTSGLSAEAALRLRAPLGKTTELWVTSRYRYLGVTIEELSALGLESLSPAPGFSAGVGLHWRH